MIERILASLESEIVNAIGRPVTRDGHNRLSKLDSQHDGWVRYKRALIQVWDLKEKSIGRTKFQESNLGQPNPQETTMPNAPDMGLDGAK
jgi:hypothetical protein